MWGAGASRGSLRGSKRGSESENAAPEPSVGTRTFDVHCDGHHRGYTGRLESALGGTRAGEGSPEVIMLEGTGSLFDNAAQVWNMRSAGRACHSRTASPRLRR